MLREFLGRIGALFGGAAATKTPPAMWYVEPDEPYLIDNETGLPILLGRGRMVIRDCVFVGEQSEREARHASLG